MDGAAAATTFGVLLQILFLDLLLSGDNALVIALACRKLPPEQARAAAWLGATGAILFRLVLTLMAGALMSLPFLQFLSALPLMVIALNLMREEAHEEHVSLAPRARPGGMLAAAGIIVVSDAAMSLDNVVALAAVAGGSFWLLAFGLLCTIPLIVFGSLGFTMMMRAFPLLVDAGAAMLGWVAGAMIVGDPFLAAWVKVQAPALGLAMPLACAIFVLVQGRLAREAPGSPTKIPRPAKAVQTMALPTPEPAIRPLASKPEATVAKADVQAEEGDDRWMFLGLAALFVVFGVFLLVVVMIPD
jgi:YjbE family integral membrane protein